MKQQHTQRLSTSGELEGAGSPAVTAAAQVARRDEKEADPVWRARVALAAERPLRNAELKQTAHDLRTGEFKRATAKLSGYLGRHPADADALFLEAKAAEQLGRPFKAAALLERCLRSAPLFQRARYNRAKLLLSLHDYNGAMAETDALLSRDAANVLFRQLRAELLAATGEETDALAIWEDLTRENPDWLEAWIAYGTVLRATGFLEQSIAALRKAIAIRASFGQAWWSLANLKTFRFGDDDVRVMQEQLQRPELDAEDRVNLLFALGKAHEDGCAYQRAFECYVKANAARRVRVDHDWEAIEASLDETRTVFTPSFLENRRSAGLSTHGAIFIVGRPRSGSTLVEQILASHPAIEGTGELPYISDMAFRLDRRARAHGSRYPKILETIDSAELTIMGEEYLHKTARHRKLDRPFFIDKAPPNYRHAGLILLILPNARIIDARRHPAASCLSMFKHNYTDTNKRLGELGRAYRNYVGLMAHFDRVAPGRVHRVIYEKLIANPERETWRLLEFLGLPFEEDCLKFYETRRAVRSPSSEQVRRPISQEAVDHWRHFATWLSPLIESLGSAYTAYPDVPYDLR